MTIYMRQCPVYTIMMIGLWSSDAFMRYNRKQVDQFSHNVSHKMISFHLHCHILDLEPAVSHLDPRQTNHLDNAKTRSNIGGNLSKCVLPPLLCIYIAEWKDARPEMLEFIDGESILSLKWFRHGEKIYQQSFQEKHVAYPNLFYTCRNIRRYDQCRPLVSKPFVIWRPTQGVQEHREWP